MNIKDAVAAETAIVEEKKILKRLIRFRRRLPRTAKPRERRIVVGTVYRTNKPDRERLIINESVVNSRWY